MSSTSSSIEKTPTRKSIAESIAETRRRKKLRETVWLYRDDDTRRQRWQKSNKALSKARRELEYRFAEDLVRHPNLGEFGLEYLFDMSISEPSRTLRDHEYEKYVSEKTFNLWQKKHKLPFEVGPTEKFYLFPILPFHVTNYNGCVGKYLKQFKEAQWNLMLERLGLLRIARNRKNFSKIIELVKEKQLTSNLSKICRALVPMRLPTFVLYTIIDYCLDDPWFKPSRFKMMKIICQINDLYASKPQVKQNGSCSASACSSSTN